MSENIVKAPHCSLAPEGLNTLAASALQQSSPVRRTPPKLKDLDENDSGGRRTITLHSRADLEAFDRALGTQDHELAVNLLTQLVNAVQGEPAEGHRRARPRQSRRPSHRGRGDARYGSYTVTGDSREEITSAPGRGRLKNGNPPGNPNSAPRCGREDAPWHGMQSAGYEERSLPNAWWGQYRPAHARRVGAFPASKLEARSLLSTGQN